MSRIKIFISSVQYEFTNERKMLYDYLRTDALFGKLTDPFIFEVLPAVDIKPDTAYLEQVRQCDIYLGIFGQEYGNPDASGVSPTEHEFNFACDENKTRLIFISSHSTSERDPREAALIKKAEKELVRKKFDNPINLKNAVYSSLIRYLEEKEIIRTGPFDASICKGTTISDVDPERILWFVRLAREKRSFHLSETTETEIVLRHLNLYSDGELTNASILLFGRQPQKYFISSEIKCAQFTGTTVNKPIQSYQIYKGDVFQLVDQAVDFVLSRIDISVGTREKGISVPTEYEIPRDAVAEAIVNAVAHRDYTSNGSVQVMLFRDRLEVTNPGHLPHELPLATIKTERRSIPANPLLADPMFYAAYIEKLGTGIPDLVERCLQAGLKEPEFESWQDFKIIIWRRGVISGTSEGRSDKIGTFKDTRQDTRQDTGQDTGQDTRQDTRQEITEIEEPVRRVILVMKGRMKRQEIQDLLGLKDRENFLVNYLNPSLEGGFIEMTIPDAPTSKNQQYRLTEKGRKVTWRLRKIQENKK